MKDNETDQFMKNKSKIKILFFEDNSNESANTEERLESILADNFEVITAADLTNAFNVLETDHCIDLIIIEIAKTKSTNFNAVIDIQQSYPRHPIIAIIPDNEFTKDIDLIKYGVQDCLVKEKLDSEQLIRAIQYSIERKNSQVELEQKVIHDSLTGLSKRALFIQHLEHTLHLARRNNTGVAVVFIDLDHFKEVNDSHGHLVGDRLLVQVAKKLKASCRKSDLISRYAGDEFAIILENLLDGISISTITEKLSKIGTMPFMIENPKTNEEEITVNLTLSMGVSVFPADTEMVYELINCADLAMYEAKTRGRNQLVFYSEIKDKK